jgi:hypothetical protein
MLNRNHDSVPRSLTSQAPRVGQRNGQEITMLRKTMFALGSVIFLSAMAAAPSAQARMGGFHGGGFHGGGFRGAAFRGGFIGPRVASHRFAHPHFARFNRFHHRRFAFAAVPIFVGASYYDPCWVVRYTPWGPRRVYVCGYY